jgi:hypothetical protein
MLIPLPPLDENNYADLYQSLGVDTVVVNTNAFTTITKDNAIAIAKYIDSHRKETNKNKICFDITSEGITYHQINVCNKIILELIEIDNTKYHPRNFYLALGCAPDTVNVTYYKQHCERFNWVEVNCLFKNNLEVTSANNYVHWNPDSGTINNEPKIKNKKFMSLNRHVKWERLHIVAQIIKRNLLDKGYVSCYLNSKTVNLDFDTDSILRGLHHYLPNTYLETEKIIQDNWDLFPLNLDLENLDYSSVISNIHKVNNTQLYSDCYFGIVTESKFFHDKDPGNIYLTNPALSGVSLDCYMFTEKIYKFISTKLPFILAGYTGSLDVLKRAGYKTFHPYIDESYDKIENDEERLQAICDEMERLCSKSDQEFLEWQRVLQPIVDHNYNLLKEQRNIHLIYRIR